jgi:hypothetical protein
MVNKNRANLPRVLNQEAFNLLVTKLTHTALIKIVAEWESTKKNGEKTAKGDKKVEGSMALRFGKML